MVWVKVCGITNEADARACLHAGVDAIGLNLVAQSKRSIDPRLAADLVKLIAGRATTVLVVADRAPEELVALYHATGADLLQLHGHESPEVVAGLSVPAFKAVRIGGCGDVEEALRFPGQRILADAKSAGALGGTGETFDWSLVESLARQRELVLAGGLRPGNVAHAVSSVRPWGVDVASGVEAGDPRLKDHQAIEAFVTEAREAARALPR